MEGTLEKDRQRDVTKNANGSAQARNSTQAVTMMQRSWFGLGITLNARQLHTLYQDKNVPRCSRSEPQVVPSRRKFLRRTAFNVLCSCLVIDIFSLGNRPDRNPTLLSKERVPFFGYLGSHSLETILTRFKASFNLWVNIHSIFRIFQGILVILAFGSWVQRSPEFASTIR